MPTKKVAICGYYGYGNTGDEAILAAIIQSITERCDVEITVFSGDPEDTIKKHGVNAVYIGELSSLHQIVKTIYNADLLLIGGGGIIHDLTFRNFKFWLNKIIIGKIFHKTIMLYSPGVGPIKTSLGKILTKYTMNSVETIHVRNELSKEVLISCGINKSLIQVTSDPVMALTPANSERVKEILDTEGICRVKPLVGISVRWNPYEHSFDSEFVENFVGKMAQISDYIIEKLDVNVVFIPMQFPPKPTCDVRIMNPIHQMMRYKQRAKIIRGIYTPPEMMGIFGQMDMVIGMRLHSLIFSARMNVPMIGLAYSGKVNEFLKMIEQDKWSVDYIEMELADIFDKINYVWGNRYDIKKVLVINAEKMKQKAIYNAEIAETLLNNTT